MPSSEEEQTLGGLPLAGMEAAMVEATMGTQVDKARDGVVGAQDGVAEAEAQSRVFEPGGKLRDVCVCRGGDEVAVAICVTVVSS